MPLLRLLAFIGYFLLGLLQLTAIIAGLDVWLGWYWIVELPLALILAYMPIVGTILGMAGAVYGWHWSWLSAFLLFFWPFLVVIVISIVSRND